MEKKRSRPFIEARKQHLVETAEDYTELIADLVESDGEARTCEIATNLGVTHVTVIRTLRRLQNEGFLETAPHKPVVLTQKGKKLASQAKKRHQILLDFLLKLGVPKDAAEMDAEGMEHHVSPVTLKAIQKFIES